MKNGFHNWSDVRVFLAVSREGSTLAASKTLGMAQPTVARRIEALEHVLGLTLFIRDTRGFRPTNAAQGLLPLAEEMERSAFHLAELAKDERDKSRSVIRITATPSTFSENFARLLGEFTQAHPSVSFKFLPVERKLDIGKGEADIGIRHAADVEDPVLICRKISVATASLYASQSYAEKYGLPTSPDDLSGHRLIVASEASHMMFAFHQWLRQRISPDQIVMECNDFQSMITGILSGFGIGAVGSGVADTYGALVRCFPPPPETEVPTWLLISPEAHRRPEVRAFSAFFAPRYSAFLKKQRAEFAERAEARAAAFRASQTS